MSGETLAVLEYGALGIVAMMVVIAAKFAWRALDVFQQAAKSLADAIDRNSKEVSQLRTDAIAHFDAASKELDSLGERIVDQASS